MTPDHDRIEQQARHSGLQEMWRRLRPLRSAACWLQIGAHPDDEWNALLAWLALGHGVRTVFACALRGEGGQNAVGPEQGHDLGVLRSREMTLAAAEIGLAVRFLTTGETDTLADFGFSRTGTDTLARWGEDRLTRALVEVIRAERPDVVVPSFLDVPGQHGHHRAITATTWKAVALAADPGYGGCELPVWQVAKTYLPAFSGASASYDDREPPPPATVAVDLGAICRELGASWVQIGERSRRFHASQGMGRWIATAGRSLALHQRSGPPDQSSPLDHLPRQLAELPAADEPHARLLAADAAIDAALAGFPDWSAMADALHLAIGHIRAVPPTGDPGTDGRLGLKLRQLSVAAAHALGLPSCLDLPPPPWRAGDSVAVRLPTAAGTVCLRTRPIVPAGWQMSATADGVVLAIPPDAAPFGSNRPGFDPLGGNEPVAAAISWSHGGVPADIVLDPPDPVMLAPERDAVVEPEAVAAVPGRPATIRLTGAEMPDGWPVLSLRTQGDTSVVELAPGSGRRVFAAGGARLRVARHFHVGSIGRTVPAQCVVRMIDVAIDARARVGVLEGASAGLSGWLRQIGIAAQPIESAEAIAGFSCVLVGHFGFARHPAATAGLDRLLAWVRDGGSLVTLYHRPQDRWPGPKLLPIEIGIPSFRWRVTLPDAPVRVLAPRHPLLCRPNRLGPADWEGWVRERGLYFASAWHQSYLPLLATGDPGETELQGGLLVRELGRGRHVHVALALHHQFPALVPGAFRLLANLVATCRPDE